MKKSKVLMIAGLALMSASMVSADLLAQYTFGSGVAPDSVLGVSGSDFAIGPGLARGAGRY